MVQLEVPIENSNVFLDLSIGTGIIRPEVYDWLGKQFGRSRGPFNTQHPTWWVTSRVKPTRRGNGVVRNLTISCLFCFHNPNDAMLFKLTWV